jgi:hypothetical protein
MLKRRVKSKSQSLLSTSLRYDKWKGIFRASLLSICLERGMGKPMNWRKSHEKGGDASRCILRDSHCPSIKPDKQPLGIVNAIASIDWRSPIIAFLRRHYELVKAHDMKRMQAQVKGYVLKDDNLFKLGVCTPLLKCIPQEQGIEAHERNP